MHSLTRGLSYFQNSQIEFATEKTPVALLSVLWLVIGTSLLSFAIYIVGIF